MGLKEQAIFLSLDKNIKWNRQMQTCLDNFKILYMYIYPVIHICIHYTEILERGMGFGNMHG